MATIARHIGEKDPDGMLVLFGGNGDEVEPVYFEGRREQVTHLTKTVDGYWVGEHAKKAQEDT